MATDYQIGLKIDDAEAQRKLQSAIQQTNEMHRAAERQRLEKQRVVSAQREIVALAKQERQEAFNKLSAEERLTRLMERREQLTKRIAQAEGNASRQAQLKLAQRRNEADIRSLEKQAADGSLGAYFLGGLATRIPGADRLAGLFGRLPGSLAGRIGLGAAGGVAGASWFGMSRAIGAAGGLVDLQGRTDMDARSLQRLAYVAGVKGGGLDQYISTIEDAKRARAKAVTLGGDDLRSFEALGFTLKQLQTTEAEEIFYQIAAAMKEGKIGADQYNALLQVLGPQSRSLFGAMKKGAAEAAAEFDRLNLALSDGLITKLAAIGTFWQEASGRAAAKGKSWLMKGAGFGVEMTNALGAGIAGLLGMKDVQEIMLNGDPSKAASKAAPVGKPAPVKTAEELAEIEKQRTENAKAILNMAWEELSADEQALAAKEKLLNLEKALRTEKDELRREGIVAEMIQAQKAIQSRAGGSELKALQVDAQARMGLIRGDTLTAVQMGLQMRSDAQSAILRRIDNKLDRFVQAVGGPAI